MDIELIADYACITGEGPLWHPTEKKLYWIDIPAGRIFRYDPAAGSHEMCGQDRVIGGFTIQADGDLLLFMDRGTVKTWRDGRAETVIEEIPGETDNRCNDVIADPAGRVFFGTMSTKTRPGRLYRLDTDRRVTAVLEGVGTSNGMGFTLDRQRMYHTDSRRREIRVFEYDRATGAIAHPQVFLQLPEGEGVPDGLTVDAEGFVWSARWDGGCLVRYSPEGREERRIAFPARKVSSVTFGGEDYTDIYVTTARGNDKTNEGAGAGALFRLNLGIRGVPEFPSRIQARRAETK